ncbi:phenazine biosynthesis protein [Pseudomonas aeruginosa]|nr:phenazine biosynthesis protein [Pseudomonas aeruginosa]
MGIAVPQIKRDGIPT